MPKKTKKEKIIALYRKKIRLLQIELPAIKQTVTEKIDVQPKEPVANYFFSDFKKSLILIVFIIALEFSLYFVTISNYLKF